MLTLSPRLMLAINVAAIAHDKQTRKGANIPYISHPFAVMYLASQATEDEDILIACLFHDIIEDVPEEYSEEQMRLEFGNRVTSIVLGVTKDDSLASWKARSDAYLHHLEHDASDESVLVSCADKIHNLMSILQDYEIMGDSLWARFNAGKEDQQWWYRSVYEVVNKRLPNLAINDTLDAYTRELELI